LISIIIPFFNSERTLTRAIYSVTTQEFSDWELILINDGSSDSSEELAQIHLSDPRVSYLYQENRGVSAARNRGAAHAKGEWLIFLDADDSFRSGVFIEMAQLIKNCKANEYLVFGINRIEGNQNREKLPKDGEYYSRIPGTFLIRKQLFDKLGGYDERFKFSENTELFHRINLAGARGKNVSLVSLNYFDNPTGGSKNLKNMVDSLTLFLEKHEETLSDHVKHLYHQIIGVNQMRLEAYGQARASFLLSLKFRPNQISTWGRLGISCFPFLAKKLYRK
jgi:glycosyltransferase involved in cell wall biosynthesis